MRPCERSVGPCRRQTTPRPQVKVAEVPQPEGVIDADAASSSENGILIRNGGELGSGNRDVMSHPCRIQEIPDERLADAGQPRSQRQSYPEIPVGQAGERRVEATYLTDQFGAGENARRAARNDVASKERISDIAIHRWLLGTHHVELAVEQDDSCARPGRSGRLLDGAQLRDELPRSPDIVVVKKRHPGGGGMIDRRVAAGGDPTRLFVANHMHARVTHLGEKGFSPVGRSVIDDDDFDLNTLLVQCRSKSASQQASTVPGGDDDGNFRRRSEGASVPCSTGRRRRRSLLNNLQRYTAGDEVDAGEKEARRAW